MFLTVGGQINPFTPGAEAAPSQARREMLSKGARTCHHEVLREQDKGIEPLPYSGPLTSQAGLVMPLSAGAETQPAAAWGGQCGGVPQEGRYGVPCPDSLRVLSVTMGRLVAELPVIISAIALDVDAAHAVP